MDSADTLAMEMDEEFRDNNGIRYLIGKRQALHVCFDNYLFLRVNGNLVTRKWECINNKSNCDAYVITKNGILIDHSNIHNHPRHDEELKEIEFFKELRKRVRDSPSLSIGKIFKDALKEDDWKILIPKLSISSSSKNVVRALQKYRQSLFSNILKLVDDDGNEISEELMMKDAVTTDDQEPCGPKDNDIQATADTTAHQQNIGADMDLMEMDDGCHGDDDYHSDDFDEDPEIPVAAIPETPDSNGKPEMCSKSSSDSETGTGTFKSTPTTIKIVIPGEEDDPVNLEKEGEAQPDFNLIERLTSTSTDFKTLSSLSTTNGKSSPTVARKIGERCCVCGDELIESEALACNEETFRKACRYLNVRSEREWFLNSGNGQFHSFCDLCSKEIFRIHDLYKKVEEIQTMIFRKVETVEKRVVDAEVVDTWVNSAARETDNERRFEGFRKQVIMNYSNKLKLRRKVRERQKTGQQISEAVPVVTPQMFVNNPSTIDKVHVGENDGVVTAPETENSHPGPVKRKRGRPKSKKVPEERKLSQQSILAQSQSETGRETRGKSGQEIDNNDVSFQDCNDGAASDVSEKELELHNSDPKKLQAGDLTSSQENDDDDSHEENFHNDFGDEDDIQYEQDSSDNEDDWTRNDAVRKKAKLAKPTPLASSSEQANSFSTPSSSQQSQKKRHPWKVPIVNKNVATPPQEKLNFGFEFPETTLRRDGRLFMQGIEIIKNPPRKYCSRLVKTSFTCGACKKFIPDFLNIRLHICGRHLGLFKCTICQKTFTEPKKLERHQETEHVVRHENMFNCSICEKPCKSEESLRHHKWSHLSEEEKKDPINRLMCSFCSRTFRRPWDLEKHELSHNEEEAAPLQCQFCGHLSSSRKNLWGHEISCSNKMLGVDHRINEPVLPFSCGKCPKAFRSQAGFTNHRRVCTGGNKSNINISGEMEVEDNTNSTTTTDHSNSSSVPSNATEETISSQS